jgi:hemoglobin/transferrin/lactoferrin receptor protein
MQDFGRVNILIDGARQDYQISAHNANGTFYLDPQFVGQADIVRGPVSNIYRSGGIGWVVSFNTMGVDSVLNPDERYGALQRFVVGTNGSGVVTSISGAASVGPNVDLYAQFLYRNSTAYADGDGNTVPDSGSSVLGGLFKLNVRPSEGQQISLSALTQNDQFANNGASTRGARFDDNVTTGTYTLGYAYRRRGPHSSISVRMSTRRRHRIVRRLSRPTLTASIPRLASFLATRSRTRSTAMASTPITPRASRLARLITL